VNPNDVKGLTLAPSWRNACDSTFRLSFSSRPVIPERSTGDEHWNQPCSPAQPVVDQVTSNVTGMHFTLLSVKES